MKLLTLPLLLIPLFLPDTFAERPRKQRRARKSAGDFEANRLLKKAKDFLSLREHERGEKMLLTIIEQYPQSFVRFKAWLALGKHYLDTHKQEEAVRAFAHLKQLKKTEKKLRGDELELYLEGLYLTGVALYQTRQYNATFPILRQITRTYPNTIWANQAYYYIGMCHFMQKNWNKAIESLSLVGTFVDPESDSIKYIEAGHRYYIKINDADLPILKKLGRNITVEITTEGGDREVVPCTPLSSKGETYIASIATRVASASPETHNDATIQILGGDTLTVVYMDDNTIDGEHNIPRESITRVVSTANLDFTLGTYEGKAVAAFIGQPLFMTLKEADLDKTDAAETAKVQLISRYRVEKKEDENAPALDSIDIEKLFNAEEEEEQYEVRDEVTVDLQEFGELPVHSGRFVGKVELLRSRAGQDVDKTDSILACDINDEIIVSYTDHLHINGDVPRLVMASIRVVGELDGRPQATQNVVYDAVIRARKQLVEGSAFLELGRIFRDMGLMDGACERSDEGIEKVEEIIKLESPMPQELREKAYQLKWKMQMTKRDYSAAIQTCHVFNQIYPDSPLVDMAMKEIGMIHLEKGNYEAAISIFREILKLRSSQAKPEAAFRIAEAIEESKTLSAAVPAYRSCSSSYPDSEFAGAALAKEVDYYYDTKDYMQANELLDQIFQDYPDAPFLDKMLIKWVLIAYRMGDFAKAQAKGKQLLFEYPSSPYAGKIKRILPKIEKKLNRKKEV
ncbi:MAG: tetratricopeptide repeat protein [Planctomycetota bacterium]|nr:tetratricopeptide repeat protein [Planctomycetota bacterium]